MKLRIKSDIFSLLAGIIVLICSCTHEPQLKLIVHKTLDSFPSGSAIEYHNNLLYLFGDDASYFLILDSNYNMVDTVTYFTDLNYRISKEMKPDIESAAILEFGDQSFLYGFGSMSTINRKSFYTFPLNNVREIISADFSLPKLEAIKEWNIEGAAIASNLLVLANRANQTHQTNYLIITNSYQTNQNSSRDSIGSTTIIQLDLEKQELVKGISGLYYSEENDLLLFTASEENTLNAYSDGTIGDSYIGWIKRFSEKLKRSTIKPDVVLSLSSIHKDFVSQKIESVCIETSKGKEMIVHLVADNDKGNTELFKLSLAF